MKLGKNFFISLQKLFSFSRKSNFRILDIQTSWCQQMPKTRNTFYWKFGQFISYYKQKNFIKKFKKNCNLETSSQAQRIKHNLYWNMKFLKWAIDIRHVLAKLLKFVQISTLTPQDCFLHRIPWKLKRT